MSAEQFVVVPAKPAPLVFVYTNYKGETEIRHVIPSRVWWGSTPWHPTPQWVFTAFDLDKNAERNFALDDMVRQP